MTPNIAATPTLMTAEEFVRDHAHERVELVKGQIEALDMSGFRHGKVCSTTVFYQTSYVLPNDLGHVVSNDSFVQTANDPDSVLGPDVAYFSYARLAEGSLPEGLPGELPDLAIEMRSPSDSWPKLLRQINQYLKAGVRVGIILDPESATATVFRPGELPQIFDNGDDLVIADVLPGFSVPVRKLFE